MKQISQKFIEILKRNWQSKILRIVDAYVIKFEFQNVNHNRPVEDYDVNIQEIHQYYHNEFFVVCLCLQSGFSEKF